MGCFAALQSCSGCGVWACRLMVFLACPRLPLTVSKNRLPRSPMADGQCGPRRPSCAQLVTRSASPIWRLSQQPRRMYAKSAIGNSLGAQFASSRLGPVSAHIWPRHRRRGAIDSDRMVRRGQATPSSPAPPPPPAASAAGTPHQRLGLGRSAQPAARTRGRGTATCRCSWFTVASPSSVTHATSSRAADVTP